ncbi:hypothetical protein CEXT_386711 [Caerostris extrusa]|uniref:Uncharacterized protein n=1 Tax=Caerostris extrusa TaxID=172846 RepID=A0AAV4REC0_CAEEX|nr:hypothetical protein CEXT_386711 [Caerostris extrusa]
MEFIRNNRFGGGFEFGRAETRLLQFANARCCVEEFWEEGGGDFSLDNRAPFPLSELMYQRFRKMAATCLLLISLKCS